MVLGLLRPDAAWQDFLQREGVAFDIIGDHDPDSSTVLIAPCEIEQVDAERVERHIHSGGSLIADVSAAQRILPELVGRPVRLRRLAADRTFLFMNQSEVELNVSGRLLRPAPGTDICSCYPMLTSTRRGRGLCFVLPFDLYSAVSNLRSVERRFPADAAREPFETVAAVDRGAVRRLVANGLRVMAWARGEPYVHLGYCPPGLTSGFGVRVDIDSATSQAIENAVGLARSRGMRFTWFVSTGASLNLESLVRVLRGQDIQLHCHLHRVFPDEARNRENLERAREILRRVGVNAHAAAAPYGDWTSHLGRVYVQMQLSYSSEFSFAYDDLPGRPFLSERERAVLQVPVHPISMGRLVWARLTPAQMVAYFKRVIDMQAARLEPCFLYDHPDKLIQLSDVAAEVLDYGLSTCGGELNMTDYATWWLRRDNLRVSAIADREVVTIESPVMIEEDMTLTVEWPDRYATIVLRPGRFRHRTLDYKSRLKLPAVPRQEPGLVASVEFRLRALRRRIQKCLQTRRGKV